MQLESVSLYIYEIETHVNVRCWKNNSIEKSNLNQGQAEMARLWHWKLVFLGTHRSLSSLMELWDCKLAIIGLPPVFNLIVIEASLDFEKVLRKDNVLSLN